MLERCFPMLLILLIGTLLVTPGRADDMATAVTKRAAVEADGTCPGFFPRGNAVRATTCRTAIMRPLNFYDAMTAGNLATARRFDAGKISAEQFVSETKARANEFEAQVEQGRQNWERERVQQQCNRIISAMANPWITSGLEAAALEKLRQSRMPALGPRAAAVDYPQFRRRGAAGVSKPDQQLLKDIRNFAKRSGGGLDA